MGLLSLETWRRIVSYNPLHFFQLAHPEKAPIDGGCNDVVRQYSWQARNAVGREEVERAIGEAERKLKTYLNYSVGARYVTVTVPLTETGYLLLRGEGKVLSIGAEKLTLLGNVAVVLSDTDSDGLYDTFTATLLTALTSDPAGTIAVYVPDAARVRGRSDWRVRPVTVTTQLIGSVYQVVIQGPSPMIVRPILYEGMNPTLTTLDPTALGNYLSTVDIYQRTTDVTKQATISVELGGSSGTISVATTATITDGEVGQIQLDMRPVLYACPPALIGCGPWPPPMTQVRINVLAGVPLGNDGDLDPFWQPIVAKLASAEISGEPCACAAANHWLHHWQFDVSRQGGEEEFAFKERAMNNPFGTRRGQIAAWQDIQELAHARGFAV